MLLCVRSPLSLCFNILTPGLSQEVPLLNMPAQVDGEMVEVGMVANNGGTMAVPVGAGGFQISSMEGAFNQHGLTGGNKEGACGMVVQAGMMVQARMMGQGGQGSGFYSEFERREAGGVYDGIALPHQFLEEYYFQVRNQLIAPQLGISTPKFKSHFFPYK